MHNSTINQNYIHSCFDGEWYKIYVVGQISIFVSLFGFGPVALRNYRPAGPAAAGGGQTKRELN